MINTSTDLRLISYHDNIIPNTIDYINQVLI